jgi:uncharacterized membrane protein
MTPESTTPAPVTAKSRRWYHPRSMMRSLMIRPRVYIGTGVGLLALALLPKSLSPALRGALAWDLGGLVYLVLAFRLMSSCHADTIRRRAAMQDDSGTVILAVILLAIASSFAAIVGLIADAKAAKELLRIEYIAICGATLVISWLVTQVVFTLHYAHEHYAPQVAGEVSGGLVFPEDTTPDYWDFFYFSTSIGATSQTSDVAIRSKALRRLVTVHAITAFFFNTTVLALTINLAASLA